MLLAFVDFAEKKKGHLVHRHAIFIRPKQLLQVAL